jgi:hypothetical protein
MALSPELVSVVAAALTILIGCIIAFGHRCADESGKFDERSKTDELNEIRMAIRADVTILAIDKLWQFLVDTNQKMKKEGSSMDVRLLLYDVIRREPFNKLVNDLEQTFKESMNTKDAWVMLKTSYGRLGKILYVFSATLAFIGYPLLCLSSQTVTLLSTEQLILSWILIAILGIVFLGLIVYIHRTIASNRRIYQEKRQYLVDGVKIGK